MQQVCACQYNFCYCSSPWVSGLRSSIDVVLLKTQVLVCVWTACTATADTAKLMHGKTFIRENRCKPLLALGNQSSAAAWENAQQHCTKTRTHTNLLVLPFYSQWLTHSGILCFRRPAPVRTSPSKKKNKRSSQQQPANAAVAANFTSQYIVGGQTARQTSKQKEQNYSLFQLHFYAFLKQHSWRCLIQHGRAACTPAFPYIGWRGAGLACSAGSSWRFWCPAWTGEGCLHMVWGPDPGWRRNT